MNYSNVFKSIQQCAAIFCYCLPDTNCILVERLHFINLPNKITSFTTLFDFVVSERQGYIQYMISTCNNLGIGSAKDLWLKC